MKINKLFTFSLFCLALIANNAGAQDYANADTTGLPGDNFSLEGALEMFKQSKSPEDFEKLINSENNKVNNLDLNDDGQIDYIKVINKKDENIQIFILQAVVSETENQDIAVIELEKTGAETAVLQIVGDEDIFGDETIVEPSEESGNAAAFNSWNSFDDGQQISGPSAIIDQPLAGNAIIVNVWAWPSVRFVYAPAYRLWVSPWAWAARPIWWRPWRPITRIAYAPVRYQYRHRYVVVPTRRVVRARVIYRPVRVTSVTVRTHNQVAVTHYRSTRTLNRNVKATRKKTTVQGPRGNKVTRTKTRVRRH